MSKITYRIGGEPKLPGDTMDKQSKEGDKQNKLNAFVKYVPSSRQVLAHFTIMFTFSCLLGPLIGPWLVNWINPPQAWGITTKIGDYSPMSVLLWGCAFLMFEAFIYTGWLIARARRGWEKEQPKSWYN